MTDQPTRPQIYTPTALFRVTALFFVAATVWLGREMWLQPQAFLGVLFAGVAIVTVTLALNAFARAAFDGESLTYTVPLRPDRILDRAQIDHVELGGRRTQALIILYHPHDAAGLIDGDILKSINLPPLDGQLELLDWLEGRSGEDEG